MFVRPRANASGSVSVQVIDKSRGYRVVKTIGVAREPDEIERLVEQGHAFIARQSHQYSLFPLDEHDNGRYDGYAVHGPQPTAHSSSWAHGTTVHLLGRPP